MSAVAGPVNAPRHFWAYLGLLWLMGIDLRLTVLAVPPVLTLIHRDLRLTEAGVGALTGLPVFLLAAAAILGSLLIARMSAVRAATLGLVVVAVGSALRGVGPSVVMLFAMTLLMGVGISVTQPALPALTSQWFAARIGLATAVYANGMLVGETVGAAFTLPVVLPLVGGRWEWSFVVWAVPVLLTALMLRAVPAVPAAASGERLWWPDWRGTPALRLGFTLGGASVSYFGCNAFIPEFLHATGRADLIGPCLTALNAGQLPASVLIALFAPRLIGRRGPMMACGALTLVGVGTFLAAPPPAMVVGAGIIGFFTAQILILTLAMASILTEAQEVHRLSAGMFAVAYTCTFLLPLLAGAAWDATHVPIAAFAVVALGSVMTVTAASGLRR
jgi:CP family cyanate transporter-like MFS transporter